MSSTSGDDGHSSPRLSISNDERGDTFSSSDDDDDEPPMPVAKKIKIDENQYSTKSFRMMQNMGFDPQKGLGKSGQGRIEPIEASDQKGRRGFGLKLEGLDVAATKFDPTMEHVQIRETAEWLHSSADDLDSLSRDDLESWLVVGEKKMKIDDESKFCDPDILEDVLSSKSVFDQLGSDDLRKARTRSNPFETIRGSIFLNRAAVKMANMDSVLDFMFTNPVDEFSNELVRDEDLLYFADVCAGPGGFSEYILWRKGWQAKGFGFTLRSENDFKLHDFFAGNPETFDPYYGINENGNIFDPSNIESLTKYVLCQTQESGVHFMMADGGFSVENQENLQEILSKQLYLCQCIVALSIVREKGHFVCKMFDLFTPFSVGLVYLMYKCFQQICILKPNTSRPANSERYLVCKWKKPNTDTIQRHLFEINKVMWANRNNNSADFLELVPHDVLERDEQFFNYVVESNNRLGRNQIAGLLKISAYCKDPKLKEMRQAEIRSDCLNVWQLPDEMRKAPHKKPPDQMFRDLMGRWFEEKQFLQAAEYQLKSTNELGAVFPDPPAWYFVPLDAVNDSTKNFRTFFMSRGGCDVLTYTLKNGQWTEMRDICLELSPNTLIYGEIVKELTGEGQAQTVVSALHIIDGIVLGGVDIRSLPITKRIKMCEKFAAALNKPGKTTMNSEGLQQPYISISCKKLHRLTEMHTFFDRLKHYKLKDRRIRLGQLVRNAVGPPRFYVPRGLLFFRDLKPTLVRAFSQTHNRPYFFDKVNNKSFFENEVDPNVVYGSFKSTFVKRKLWTWENENQVKEDYFPKEYDEKLLYRAELENYLYPSEQSNST